MTLYRKKPIEVEAIQFVHNMFDAMEFAVDNSEDSTVGWSRDSKGDYIYILTDEGTMRAYEDDWIIKGVAGEIYPCKDEIFQQTYEKVT